MITAVAGLALLIAVVISSLVIVRRRLRYETWYFVHLYTYLAIALAFSHQIATGREFVGDPAARLYWQGLYVATLAAVLVFRFGLPLARNLRHRLRVERVIPEAPGFVSVEIGGAQLGRLKATAGQFFSWRFLTRDHWWQSHPFSLSAAPDGRRLRITVKEVGDFSSRPEGDQAGHAGGRRRPARRRSRAAARTRPRVALIAGGVGITPIRALLEEMPGGPGDIALVYRALREDDVILREELEELAQRRGVELHYVLGDHRGPGRRSCCRPSTSARLVPDIAVARRLRLRAARDGGRDGREPAPRRRPAAPGDHGAVRALMRRALAALVVTVVVVALLVALRHAPAACAGTRSRRCARRRRSGRRRRRRASTRPARSPAGGRCWPRRSPRSRCRRRCTAAS